MTRVAVVLIRQEPHYRREAFVQGLQRAGFELHTHPDFKRVKPGDVLVIWNRYGNYDDQAKLWEQRGGAVLVAENGYIGQDENGIQHYALAIGGHNGSGAWHYGGAQRWDKLGIEIKPWRSSGEHIVIRGQRGIGAARVASPPNWHTTTAHDLQRITQRRLVVQTHPGKPACDPAATAALIEALRGAHCMCIWSSAAGVRALVEGVPVFYGAPNWICAEAAMWGISASYLERPMMDDGARLAALHQMAWAQWSVAELASGEPFDLLAKKGGGS